MTTITVRQLSHQTGPMIDLVVAGDDLTITRNGEIVAHLIPHRPGVIEGLIRAGRATAPNAPLDADTLQALAANAETWMTTELALGDDVDDWR